MERRHQHGRTESGAGCSRRDGCCEGEGLAEVAVVELVVLGEPERVDAEPVSLLAQLQGERVQAGRVLVPTLRIA